MCPDCQVRSRSFASLGAHADGIEGACARDRQRHVHWLRRGTDGNRGGETEDTLCARSGRGDGCDEGGQGHNDRGDDLAKGDHGCSIGSRGYFNSKGQPEGRPLVEGEQRLQLARDTRGDGKGDRCACLRTVRSGRDNLDIVYPDWRDRLRV